MGYVFTDDMVIVATPYQLTADAVVYRAGNLAVLEDSSGTIISAGTDHDEVLAKALKRYDYIIVDGGFNLRNPLVLGPGKVISGKGIEKTVLRFSGDAIRVKMHVNVEELQKEFNELYSQYLKQVLLDLMERWYEETVKNLTGKEKEEVEQRYDQIIEEIKSNPVGFAEKRHYIFAMAAAEMMARYSMTGSVRSPIVCNMSIVGSGGEYGKNATGVGIAPYQELRYVDVVSVELDNVLIRGFISGITAIQNQNTLMLSRFQNVRIEDCVNAVDMAGTGNVFISPSFVRVQNMINVYGSESVSIMYPMARMVKRVIRIEPRFAQIDRATKPPIVNMDCDVRIVGGMIFHSDPDLMIEVSEEASYNIRPGIYIRGSLISTILGYIEAQIKGKPQAHGFSNYKVPVVMKGCMIRCPFISVPPSDVTLDSCTFVSLGTAVPVSSTPTTIK